MIMENLRTFFFIIVILWAGPVGAVTQSRTPLAWAFDFASALHMDLVDQSKAQEKIIADAVALGQLELASDWVSQIRTWRQGTAWITLAQGWLARGRVAEAVAALRRAEQFRTAYRQDWQGARVAAHLERTFLRYGSLLAGQETAITTLPVVAAADTNRLEQVLAQMQAAEVGADFDTRCALVDRYFDLAANPLWAGAPARRSEALAGVRRVTALLPVLKQAEIVPELAAQYRMNGERETAQDVLNSLEQTLVIARLEDHQQVATFARLARQHAILGDRGEADGLLKQARDILANTDPFERPAAAALLAEAYVELGETASAWEFYRHALMTASGYVNARPRVLAVVDVCRSVARQRLEFGEADQELLRQLREGLREPW